MPTRTLTKIESHLVVLAANQRDATVEAANAAFNHAIKPILEPLNVKFGTVPAMRPTPEGLVELSWEEPEEFDANGIVPIHAR